MATRTDLAVLGDAEYVNGAELGVYDTGFEADAIHRVTLLLADLPLLADRSVD